MKDTSDMLKVKLSINAPTAGLLRQTPDSGSIWGDYKFYINQEIDECDFWVVFSKGEKKNETTKISPNNLILITGEPEPIYHYDKRFIKQFGKIISCRRDINHPDLIYSQPAQPWHLGRIVNIDGRFTFLKDYNFFKNNDQISNKKKLLSVISSNKAFTKDHNDRIKFVRKIKEYFGDKLDVFGRGIHEIEDKWDAVADYKYHIALENCSVLDYWSEKLADSYLTETFPFYYGCKNLDKYFSTDSYIPIDINNLDQTIKIIEKAIAEDVFENSVTQLREAKRRVLDEYNIFALIAHACDGLDPSIPKSEVTLRHELSFFDPYKVPMILKRIYYKRFYR